MKKALRIGELARRAGVSPDTIRHYERRRLELREAAPAPDEVQVETT